MVTGLRGRIPKRDAHIYIHTLIENSVPIMCLALRRSAIINNQFVFIGSHVAIQVNPTFLVLKMSYQLIHIPKAIQVLLQLSDSFSTCQNRMTESPVHNDFLQ